MRVVVVLLAALVALAAPRSVPAQEMEPTVLAVVDVQRLLHESRAGQSIEQQMVGMRDGLAAEISQRETALREEEQALQGQAALLAPEVLAEKRRQFEEKVVALQRDVRAKQQSLEETYAGGVNQVRQVIVQILGEMVETRGIDLVIAQTAVLVGTLELDITQDVLTELDQRLPSVTLAAAGGN